jgi:hypothetical protein
MQILSKKILNKLNRIYKPMAVILDTEALNNSDKYNFSCFSVFDHRLTNEEAEQQILFYQQALEDEETPSSKRYYEYHDQFLNFYLDLYNQTTVYGVYGMFSGKYPSGVEFDNIEEYKWHVLASIREQIFLRIVLPDFYSVIEGNFDLVHLLYTLKSRPEEESKISSIIKKHGLFILS